MKKFRFALPGLVTALVTGLLFAASASAADVTLSITVTNGIAELTAPQGSVPPGATPLPAAQCQSPAGTRTCTFKVPAGSAGAVSTISKAAPGNDGVRWGGACEGRLGIACAITVSADTQVSVGFGKVSPLQVEVAGGGTVTVGEYACREQVRCALRPVEGMPLTFTATPAVGHVFQGWSGPQACATAPVVAGVNGCSFAAAAGANLLKATFVRAKNVNVTLMVDATSVEVRNSPNATSPMAACTAKPGQKNTCTFAAPIQSALYVTALPVGPAQPPAVKGDPQAMLAIWGGACSGTSMTCALVADADKSVTVSVEKALSVSVSTKPQFGTVAGSLGGVCAGDCDFNQRIGTAVTLTAQPQPGIRLVEWRSTGSTTCVPVSPVACTLSPQAPGAATVWPVWGDMPR
jgi:Divergent InlB B-repeat domain